MIPFYLYIGFVMLGTVFTYLAAVRYERGLRGELSGRSVWETIGTGVFFGSLALLLAYLVFPEVRAEDKKNGKNLFLFATLALLALHLAVSVLLFYFGAIDMSAGSGTAASLSRLG